MSRTYDSNTLLAALDTTIEMLADERRERVHLQQALLRLHANYEQLTLELARLANRLENRN